MVKLLFRPTSSAWRRRIFTPIEWKVPSQGMPSTIWPTIWPTRSFISRAALLVKVTARISRGLRAAEIEDMGDAGGQDAGFAGSGAGQHQHRPVQRLHRLALFGIEIGEIGRRRLRAHGTRGNAAGRGLGAGNERGSVRLRLGHVVGDSFTAKMASRRRQFRGSGADVGISPPL